MERQKPVNSVQHNDAYSQALIEAYGKWMGGAGFQQSTIEESTAIPAPEKKELATPGPAGGADSSTSIPSLAGKEAKADDFSTKDPKTNSGAPDPAPNLRAGTGIKQSHGSEVKDTTKVVAREEACGFCGGKGCSKCEKKDKKDMKKETVEFELNGVTYMMEKEKGLDGKACWKGYKQMGTKMKGGKRVDNCVKAGYEPEGNMLEYFEKDPKSGKMVKKHNCAKKVKKEGLEYTVIPGEHTMLEDGTVTHYDIMRETTILHNVPVEDLEIMISEVHEHVVNDAKNREVLGEKKLDPVGKEDKDVDNDGDHDKSDKYLLARRKKVSKIINTKKKMKEQAELRAEIEEEKK